MAIEREVVVRLKVPSTGRDGKAFEELSRQAKGLDRHVTDAGKSVSAMLRQMRESDRAAQQLDRVVKSLKQMGVEASAAQKAAQQLLSTIGTGGRVAEADLRRLAAGMRGLGHAAPSRGLAERMGLGGGGGAGAFGLSGGQTALAQAGIGVAVFTRAVDQIAQSAKSLEQVIQARMGGADPASPFGVARTGRELIEAERMQNLPGWLNHLILQNSPKAFDIQQTLAERQARLAGLQGDIGRAEQRRGIMEPFQRQRDELARERSRQHALVRTEADAAREGVATSMTLQRRSEAAQTRARGTLGGSAAETAARFSFLGAGQQLGIDQAKALKQLDAERGQAAGELAARQRQLNLLLNEQEKIQRQLIQAGLATDQRQEQRLNLERAIGDTIAQQKKIEESRTRLKDVEVQRNTTLLQQGQQRLALLQQERARQIGIIEGERGRLQGLQAEFGLLDPLQREQVLSQARGLRGMADRPGRGNQLTPEQWQAARGSAFLQPLLQQVGMQMGAGRQFEELLRLTRQDRPLREAQAARVAIENKIAIEIKLNEQSLTDQVLRKVVPELHKAVEQATTAYRLAMQRQALQAQANRGALQPQR